MHEVEVVVTDSVNVLLFVYTPGMTLLISMFDVLYLVCLCGGDQGRRRTFSTVAGACALRASNGGGGAASISTRLTRKRVATRGTRTTVKAGK